MTDVTGIDHIYITVSDMTRSERFYDTLMGILGFRRNSFVIDGESHIQYYNRHFGYVLRPGRVAREHDPYSPGLHHLCFRVESVEDVKKAALRLQVAGVAATNPALHPDYAPDYWATFVADPDGIRLEIANYRQERRDRHDKGDE